ncbi:MAG TPA: hypothetical protein VKO43_08980 [Candidatus Krumholzibacteriaceae bacterium]|nr:hypothetical protein [Candidatus Krumholzibacteriaceae bacterium]
MWKGTLVENSIKVFFAVILLFLLSSSFVYAEGEMAIPVDVKTGGGYSFVYLNGTLFSIYTSGEYYIGFEEYDSEWVMVDIIPCGEKPDEYSPVYIQWDVFAPVVITLESDEGETYLLGSETGYAEK